MLFRCYHLGMLKRFLLLFMFMAILPVCAGELEDALKRGEPTFLYLHTNYCKYCKQFEPIYRKVSQAHKDKCRFISIDANTPYGKNIMRQFKAGFVPFVVMIDTNRQFLLNIPPECLLDNACVDKEVKKFIN